jgi:transposase-like protein
MERDSRSAGDGKGSLEELLRERIRATIELIVEQELEEALGAANSQRVGEQRAGYRHGHRARTLSTSIGATTIAMPRARTLDENGERHEWRSRIIPRYQRRTARVDEAILGVYLSGTNTRRLRGALAPLLRGAPLSKDAVSRLVGRLREDFAAWAGRDLGALKVRYLFLDGWYPRVRIGKKRVRVPVLVTLAVCADGRREIVDLRLAGVESERAWLEVVQALAARKLGAPQLAVIDGNPGLAAALRSQWPAIAIQRCTNHKLWNLLAKAPPSARRVGGRLSAHDLRGRPRGGRAGAAWVRPQVEAALPGGLSEFGRSRRSALHFHCLPARAMEGVTYHQRAGADQRGVSPPHQDPGLVTERRGGAALNVRALAQRPDQAASRGRVV